MIVLAAALPVGLPAILARARRLTRPLSFVVCATLNLPLLFGAAVNTSVAPLPVSVSATRSRRPLCFFATMVGNDTFPATVSCEPTTATLVNVTLVEPPSFAACAHPLPRTTLATTISIAKFSLRRNSMPPK
jgi:hypothetical protein